MLTSILLEYSMVSRWMVSSTKRNKYENMNKMQKVRIIEPSTKQPETIYVCYFHSIQCDI